MVNVTLGSTGITVPKNAFGALPIQRVSDGYAIMLLQKAFKSGVRFFDTARAYTDSEKKVGQALSAVRDQIYIATKTAATTVDEFWSDLATSLALLQTDYIDIYQFHNPDHCIRPGDGSGLYEAMLEAKAQGKIRHIGITNHRPLVAKEAAESGLYETLQFPFCYLASDEDIKLVEICKEHNVGFIAMKALSGGLINNSKAAYVWQARFDNTLPIWGIQRESELDEFLGYMNHPPVETDEICKVIEHDRKELSGSFCRSCGYCMPCPKGIVINQCARMSQMIRRSTSESWLTPESQKMMMQIEECVNCGHCKSKCPYGLDTPELLKRNLEDYKKILSGEVKI